MTDVRQAPIKNSCVELNEAELDQAGAATARRGGSSPEIERATRPTRGVVKFEIDQAAP